jgi:hypothetical protein
MRPVLIATVLALLGSLPVAAQEKMPFACEGAFAAKGTHDKLVAEFGTNNVVYTQIHGAHGTTPMASVVYPTDPARRLAVVWQDEKAKANPGYVLIGVGSDWTISGVQAGMSIPEVEAVNGKPFLLSGLSEQYPGMVFDWEGGKVRTDLADCFIMINFKHHQPGSPLDLDDGAETAGVHRSDEPIYKALVPRVDTIVVTYRLVN